MCCDVKWSPGTVLIGNAIWLPAQLLALVKQAVVLVLCNSLVLYCKTLACAELKRVGLYAGLSSGGLLTCLVGSDLSRSMRLHQLHSSHVHLKPSIQAYPLEHGYARQQILGHNHTVTGETSVYIPAVKHLNNSGSKLLPTAYM